MPSLNERLTRLESAVGDEQTKCECGFSLAYLAADEPGEILRCPKCRRPATHPTGAVSIYVGVEDE